MVICCPLCCHILQIAPLNSHSLAMSCKSASPSISLEDWKTHFNVAEWTFYFVLVDIEGLEYHWHLGGCQHREWLGWIINHFQTKTAFAVFTTYTESNNIFQMDVIFVLIELLDWYEKNRWRNTVIAVLCFIFMSHYLSQCLCCVPLPNTFDSRNLEISCSVFASYLLSYLVEQNKH